MFAGHIVIGIFADDDSPLLGLRNLVMPLRCSPICFLIMCNYFNGTWYNHKTWFYKTILDCSKLITYTFMGWHTFSFLLTNHVLCVLVSSITSTTIIAAVVYILTQGFKHPIRWPAPHNYCGKHDLPCAGVGLAQVVWTSYAKIILDILLLALLLRNMPKISIMDGNPLNRADIRAVKVLRKIKKTFLTSYIYK